VKPIEHTRDSLRADIRRFVNQREKAYDICARRGVEIPDQVMKRNAIASLRRQLAASKDWSFESHILWISAMRHQVACLLPSSHHKDPRLQKFRLHVIRLLNWCDHQKSTVKINRIEYV